MTDAPRNDTGDKPGDPRRDDRGNARWIAAGAGAIGSAALVAALLYAGRAKKAKPRVPTVMPETD